MIITKIRLQEEHPMTAQVGSTSWPLPYCDLSVDSNSGDNGYILKNAAGIGPVDFVSIVEGFDTNGVPIMDSVGGPREIALRIGFKPGAGQTIGDLRSDLYKLIDRSLIVSFMEGSTTIATATGFIEKFETSHFTNMPEIQITIMCKNSELASPTTVSVPVSTLNTLTPTITYNEGDAPTGLTLVFNVTASTASFSITNYGKFWYDTDIASTVTNQFLVTYPFVAGDQVTLTTQRGIRRIKMVRSSVTYDLAGYISSGAVWPKLYPGVNTFTWTLASSWATITSATYVPRYWGV